MVSNQESEILETKEIITGDEKKPDGFKDQLANFFIRILAYVLDQFILGIVGLIVVVIFYFISKDFLIQIGQLGRLIGLVIAMAYFGILNSRIGNGQTLGKKIFKIKVVDKEGKLITLWRSGLRSLILIIPIFLNGINFDISFIEKQNILYILVGLIFITLTSISMGLVYFYIFNGQTRQAIHDLISGTFVVKRDIKDWQEFKPVKKFHYYVYCGLLLLILIGSVVLVLRFKPVLGDMYTIAKKIRTQKGYKIISMGKTFTNFSSSSNNWKKVKVTKFTIEVKRFNTNISEYDIAYEIVQTILREYPGVNELNNITVLVSTGYDIGILKGNSYINFSGTPNDWRTRKISEKKSMNGIQFGTR